MKVATSLFAIYLIDSSVSMIIGKTYQHAIPTSRLGTSQSSLVAFTEAVNADTDSKQKQNSQQAPTEFSLVVILSRNAQSRDGDGKSCASADIVSNTTSNSSSNISILLGKKLRGFGEGFYNCFGGKLEKAQGEHDHPAKGAVREINEETGIDIPLPVMEDGFVGEINFTFEDSDVNRAMRVHLYCVFVEISRDKLADTTSQTNNGNEGKKGRKGAHTPVMLHPNQIRGCDEIEPEWFHNIHDIPLDQMFADDSLWLRMLLTHYDTSEAHPAPKLKFDAWFHFHPGGTKTNSIMHHYTKINAPKLTIEKRLFHALHVNHIHSPSVKEFKENWAMANAVRSSMKDGNRMEYVLDVAGGHGALAALFLLLVPKCHTAVVIDPAQCTSGKNGVREAWSRFWSDEEGAKNVGSKKKELRYRHECLRTGLREELESILQKAESTSVTVVACHACQHLTDETLQIASEYGVNVAVMPCCQKDHDGWWKGLTKRLVKTKGNKNASMSIGVLMDLLAAGKMMGWDTGSKAGVRYEVKMKLMNESISEQNRMILCKAQPRTDGLGNGKGDERKELAHEKLTRAYHRAHQLPEENDVKEATRKTTVNATNKDCKISGANNGWCIHSMLAGFCLGASFSLVIASQMIRKNK